MADSYTDFLSPLSTDQAAGTFDNLTLDYVTTADFSLVITKTDETEITLDDSTTDFTITTAPNLKIVVDDAAAKTALAAGAVGTLPSCRIRRSTSISSPERDFSDGSVLKASDLNTAFKQVLFGIQEQVDGGVGSIPTDIDGKLDAGGKVIKNLGEPVGGTDAVTKNFVLDSLTTGAGEPQAWNYNLNTGWTVDGNNLYRLLTEPVPVSSNDNLYLVELGGVLQDPNSAYNITEVDGAYTITLLGAAVDLTGLDVTVNIRNWGTVRNELLQPFRQAGELESEHALTLQNRTSTAAGDLVNLQDYLGDEIGRIESTGKLMIPKISSVAGDLSVVSDIAVRNVDDDADVFRVDQDNTVTVSGASTFSGNAEFTGSLNAAGELLRSGIAFTGIKAIVTRTPVGELSWQTNFDLGPAGGNSSEPTPTFHFVGQQLVFSVANHGYAEGDKIIIYYDMPLWHEGSSAASGLILLRNTAASDRSNVSEYTSVAGENAFESDSMLESSVAGYDLDDASEPHHEWPYQFNKSHNGHSGSGIYVYQVSAEDVVNTTVEFDVVVFERNESVTYKGSYYSTFIGLLLG